MIIMKKMICLFISALFLNCTVYADNKPSVWAEKDVNRAVEIGIVPNDLKTNYQRNITREEFCQLAMFTVSKLYDGDITSLYKNNQSFMDTDNDYIISCAKLGIVSGMNGNKFEPLSPITREQAARMLYNTLNVSTPVISQYESDNENGLNGLFLPHNFKDGADIHCWARKEIYAMYHLGIMLGMDNDNYSPLEYYTVEQAICNFLRLYNSYKDPNSVVKPEPEIYPDLSIASKIYDDYNLDLSYQWDNKDYKYIPCFFDGYGNEYTAEEKGYVYPEKGDYMVVTTYSGPNVTNCIVIDKNGKVVTDGHRGIQLCGEDKCVFTDNGGYTLYDLKEGKEIGTYPIFSNVGNGMYMFGSDGKLYFYNSDFELVISDNYMITRCKFVGNKTILQKSDKLLSLITSEGEVLKNINMDFDKYSIEETAGRDILLNDGEKWCMFNAETEKFTGKYDYMDFNSDGNILAMDKGKYYLLDQNGDILFDAINLGYSQIDYFEKGGFYEIYSVDKSNYSKMLPYDIIDKKGNIIRKGLNNFELYSDGFGINAYKSSDYTITVFDTYGNDIGTVTSDEKIINFRFINGLIFVYAENDLKSYYTPDGNLTITNAK